MVAGELSRRGFMASVTLRNNDSIDIHASKNQGKRLIAIQVKTNQKGDVNWLLNKKAESLCAENLFYVFVAFKDLFSRPDYYIVPSLLIAERIKGEHAEWLMRPGKKGQLHVDTSMRVFRDKKKEFFEKWELLE